MSALSPLGQRSDLRTDSDHSTPEHRLRGNDPPTTFTSSRRSHWRALAEGLTGRTIVGVAAIGSAVVGLVAMLLVTAGGDGGEATLTAPAGNTETYVTPDGDDDQLVNRSGGADDVGPLGAGRIESDPTAASVGEPTADGSDDADAETEAEAEATAAAASTASTVPSLPVPAAPPTTTPTSATVASSAPPTDQPTTPPQPTTAPTTAAPATDPPTTPPPTTAPATEPPSTAAPQTQPPAPSGGSAEQQVLDLVNAERADAGCGAVALNGQLNTAALGHSQDMSANGYFSHTGLDGSQPWDRAQAAGYNYRSIGENIAQGYGSAEAVLNGWMNSSGHRANILNCTFTEMGIGRASGNYWTQLFGRPR